MCGDALSGIALRAYKDAGAFQIIYSAYAGVIGPNPALIATGISPQIPCLDGQVAALNADSGAIRAAETTDQPAPPEDQTIRVVVGAGWAPFTDESQPQGGMITEITNVALAAAEGSPEYKIDFINDWGAHLQPLISDHAYEFSLAWFRPNCNLIDKLGDGSKFRCNNLDWSEPMFEQVFGYYTRLSDPAIADYSELLGKTICRPSGCAIFQLEENDLIEPNITLERPHDVYSCFEGLVEGKYDAVALAADTADGAMADTGTKDQVRFDENLSQVLTIHAVISKTHPRGEELLAALDSGIVNIKDSGEWFSIVRRHLTGFRSGNQ